MHYHGGSRAESRIRFLLFILAAALTDMSREREMLCYRRVRHQNRHLEVMRRNTKQNKKSADHMYLHEEIHARVNQLRRQFTKLQHKTHGKYSMAVSEPKARISSNTKKCKKKRKTTPTVDVSNLSRGELHLLESKGTETTKSQSDKVKKRSRYDRALTTVNPMILPPLFVNITLPCRHQKKKKVV